jgi:hypothetical protein
MTTQLQVVEIKSKASFLTTILRADGLFALASGSAAILASAPLAGLIEMETPAALIVLGFALLGYAAMLLFFAGREPVNRRVARIAIVLNLLWVVGSYAGLLFGLFPVNAAGKWAIALTAEVVLAFGILELVALRRLSN